MLEIVKEKIQSVRKPRFRNPFRIEQVGEATHARLASLEPEAARAEFEAYDEITKQLYLDYLSARDNREFAKNVLGIGVAATLVTGIVVALTNNTDDEEDYEDEDDDEEDDDFDDEDESEDSDS